ncbi:hypothetical protein [Halobaculum lipolyticum]|uniref:Uncharacterized protein n=1 Tax=Halobaculum lipolyticum TaxID=3032001 RepID=A0ABD5W6Y3_9EURY|nr:hypothetical protein [Halobaculum sp. DT31]
MSPGSEPAADRRSAAATAATALTRTRRALAAALTDRVATGVLLASAVGYVAVSLVAVGDLGRSSAPVVAEEGAVAVTVVAAPVGRALVGEAVALATVGPVELLVTPATLLATAGLGALVGANLALSALAWRTPAACTVSPASGLAAGLPALLSGTACCGPAVFLLLGLQATGVALTAIAWLRPVAALLLAASLVWAAWRLDVRRSTAGGRR